MTDFWPARENCIIHPEKKDAKKVSSWIGNGTARGFFYSRHEYENPKQENAIMIIFDGYGNTHTSMIQHLRKDRRDYFDECFIIAEDGNIRVENIMEASGIAIDECSDFISYKDFLIELAKLIGNNDPKIIPMNEE